MAGCKDTALNLAKFVDNGVQVKLTGDRQVTGTLKGYDLLLNFVLDEAVESERSGGVCCLVELPHLFCLKQLTHNCLACRCLGFIGLLFVSGSMSFYNWGICCHVE
ncbi:hypothetical protein VPH35_132437 [Triticum aestivum]